MALPKMHECCLVVISNCGAYTLPPAREVRDAAARFGTLSDTVQMRAMLQTDDDRKLVELKAVDERWPLVGETELDGTVAGDLKLQTALADNGMVADAQLLRMLGLEPGDTARLGETTVRVSAALLYEPDRSVSFISFGPRVLISAETLAATNLAQPGAFITYKTRLLLHDIATAKQAAKTLHTVTAETNVRSAISMMLRLALMCLSTGRRSFWCSSG